MDIILLERIEKLGQMGDVVKVKAGFARNFLLPQKKALRATKENLAFFAAATVFRVAAVRTALLCSAITRIAIRSPSPRSSVSRPVQPRT